MAVWDPLQALPAKLHLHHQPLLVHAQSCSPPVGHPMVTALGSPSSSSLLTQQVSACLSPGPLPGADGEEETSGFPGSSHLAVRDRGCGWGYRTSYLREKEPADCVDWNLETAGAQSRGP